MSTTKPARVTHASAGKCLRNLFTDPMGGSAEPVSGSAELMGGARARVANGFVESVAPE